MNIKQAEEKSGVTRQNIRFYEKQGLLSPARNPDNDYREYSEENIQTLKWIRAMRMLDMPLEEIRQVLAGELDLSRAAGFQQERLETQKERLEGAIRFCGSLRESSIETLDVDDCLARMESGGEFGFFRQWKLDYLAVAHAVQQQVFTFVPDDPVTTPAEFTAALFAYADQEGLDLVVTQEGMNPTFTIDGIEYTASRYYCAARILPVAVVRCEMTHPEDYLPSLEGKRKKKLKLAYFALPGLVVFLFFAVFIVIWSVCNGASLWETLAALIITAAVIAAAGYGGWWFCYSRNEKK